MPGQNRKVDQDDDGGDEPLQLQLQRALLPAQLPQVDGLPLTARYVPAGTPDRIGGDWYDAVPMDGGTVALVVGDVAGADLTAAALTAQLSGAVRAYTLEGYPPAAVLTRANGFHLGLDTGRLASVTYALVHPAERIITVARAGHVPPLLAAPGQPACLLDSATGPPLGVRHGELWREATTQVAPGSTFALYTDGLLRDGGFLGATAGLQRLLDAVGDSPVGAPEQLADVLIGLVHEDAPDDTVLLVGHLIGQRETGPTLRRTLPPTAESASVARWLVTDMLQDLVDEDTRDTAALLTTELVSNAIRQTRDELVVTVRLAGDRLWVGVADSSHRRPQLIQVGSRDTSGRGLHLVEAMAARWGVDPDARGLGKTVWFELGVAQ
jgi:hypothetical protein